MPGHWTDSPSTWPMWDGSAPPSHTLRHRAVILRRCVREAEFQAKHRPKHAGTWLARAKRWQIQIGAIEAVLVKETENEQRVA